MTDANTILLFLGGFGSGTVITTVVQHYLSRNAQKADSLRQDRSEVFTGLLQALEALEVKETIENLKNFGFWAARTQVFGSTQVVSALAQMRSTAPNSPDRTATFQQLLAAMRKDLGVS
jgi:hypothetical protein